MERLGLETLEQCRELSAKSEVKTAVLVTARKEHLTKKGKMAFLTVEDLTGSMEVIVFSNIYSEAKALLESDRPLLLKGRVEIVEASNEEAEKEVKLMAEELSDLSVAMENTAEPLRLDLSAARLENGGSQVFKRLIQEYRGSTRITLRVHYPRHVCLLELGPQYTVASGPDFEAAFSAFAANGLGQPS